MKLPVIMLFYFFLGAICGAEHEVEKPCKVAYRCSTESHPVWTTDGKSCQVLRNKCFLNMVNCDRQNNNEPKLKEISEDKCQELCSSSCPDNFSPVCGYYNGKKKTFANQCEMEKYICKTGETYDIFRLEPC